MSFFNRVTKKTPTTNKNGVSCDDHLPAMKTPMERRKLQRFGNAKSAELNKTCTSFGEIVYMSVNPLIFAGKKGEQLLDRYTTKIIKTLSNPNPVVTEIIQLTNCEPIEDSNTTPALKLDWWDDDNINSKIINSPDITNRATTTVHSASYHQAEIDDLVPGVVDKINIVNKLISTATSCKFDDDDGDAIASPAHTHQRVNASTTAKYFMPVKRVQLGSLNTPHASTENKPSIKVSNFINPHTISVDELKSLFDSNGLYNFKYKIIMPNNNSSVAGYDYQPKDFIFINFQNTIDMNLFLDKVSKQRIKYGHSILQFEQCKPKYNGGTGPPKKNSVKKSG